MYFALFMKIQNLHYIVRYTVQYVSTVPVIYLFRGYSTVPHEDPLRTAPGTGTY
jgi:hypothetical protein